MEEIRRERAAKYQADKERSQSPKAKSAYPKRKVEIFHSTKPELPGDDERPPGPPTLREEERAAAPRRSVSSVSLVSSIDDDEFVTPPSQPLHSLNIHDVCFKNKLHPPRVGEFRPDEGFYQSENCEGVWVCVSKECPQHTLKRACLIWVDDYFSMVD